MATEDPYRAAFDEANGKRKTADADAEKEREERRAEGARDQDANSTLLRDVVIAELQEAAKSLVQRKVTVDIDGMALADGAKSQLEVSFRIRENLAIGRSSPFYRIVPSGTSVSVTCGPEKALGGLKSATNVSDAVGIRTRDDITKEKVQKLIVRAITECTESKPRELRQKRR